MIDKYIYIYIDDRQINRNRQTESQTARQKDKFTQRYIGKQIERDIRYIEKRAYVSCVFAAAEKDENGDDRWKERGR